MKNPNRMFLFGISMLLAIGFLGCMDLDVVNPDQPDIAKAMAEVADIESVLGGAYNSHWDGLHWNIWIYPSNTLSVMAWEQSSSWGNFGMLDLGRIPRLIMPNRQDHSYYRDILQNPWDKTYAAISVAIDVLNAVDLGLFEDDPVRGIVMADRKARALSWAHFVKGASYGWFALYQDQAYLFDLDVLNEVKPLERYTYDVIADTAIFYLEEAIRYAQEGPGFTLPESWMQGNSNINNQKVIELAHTFIARLLAATPRNPAERDAVDWSGVLTHIENGLSEDFKIRSSFPGWYDAFRIITALHGWTRMSYYTIGAADLSGRYQEWLNTPHWERDQFTMRTIDRRIHPTGELFGVNANPGSGKYFSWHSTREFRPDRGPYVYSHYNFNRWCWEEDSGICGFGDEGTTPHIVVAELDFLRAEALFRLNPAGNRQEIVDIINKYRVPIGEITEVNLDNWVVSRADVNHTDAQLWEMLKYEKRMETSATYPGLAYFDARGWRVSPHRAADEIYGQSDLPIGTPVHFPIPALDLELLLEDWYQDVDVAAKQNASPIAPPRR